MVSSSRTITPKVCGLQCKACGGKKESLTMELCPTCEQAVLLHFPVSYFKPDPTKAIQADKDLELTAFKVLEVLELASIDSPIDLAA